MSTALWAAKGGVGTTVVASAMAVRAARRGEQALLVDAGGDVPAVLGLVEPTGPGVAEWLAAVDAPVDGLARIEVEGPGGLRVLPRGRGPLRSVRAELLGAVLGGDDRSVIIDCGTVGARGDGAADTQLVLASTATRSLLVTRACYLALRRQAEVGLMPSGVVLVTEPGRSLEVADVEDVVGAPVVAVVPWHEAVARAVDAGILGVRLPRPLDRALRAA